MGHKIDSDFKTFSPVPAADRSAAEGNERADPAQRSLPERGEAVAPGNDRNILLVSDDERQRSLLRAYLKHVGFNVFGCADLDAALRMLALHRALRLVLVDSHLLAAPSCLVGESFAECGPDVAIFAITGTSAMDGTLRAVKHRLWEPDSQPLRLPDLLGRIQALADRQPDAPKLRAAGWSRCASETRLRGSLHAGSSKPQNQFAESRPLK